MSVYYKFNSELNYSYVDFDGLHISVTDLKKAILHQKRLGKSADFDLLISNAQTKEEYKDEQCLIPKNTSLIVARIPISNQNKKNWEIAQSLAAEKSAPNPSSESINHDITRMNGTEEDKIQAMMMQSTLDYDPTNYQRVRGATQTGDVPANYRCHKCNKPGHWIKNCPLNPPGGKDYHHHKVRPESKKMTGIPRSLRDNLGVENQDPVQNQNQFVEEKREIPEDLICAICKSIFKDAVMIPCCGSSFCDDCVRTALLESEDNECPDCKEKGTTPGSLIPNRFLRNAVSAFHAESSNVLGRDKQKATEEPQMVEEKPEEPQVDEEQVEEEMPRESEELQPYLNEDELPEMEDTELPTKHGPTDKESESEDDDDNITVTVPPAHQQSRGASFRDSRLRRIPSHNAEFHESFSHQKGQPDDSESYEDETNDSYNQRQHGSTSKRGNHYEHSSSSSSQPQGISTLLGDDKGSNHYHSSSSSHVSSQNMPHGESYQQQHQQQQHQQQQQQPQMYNQNQPHQSQHSGLMPSMHQHSMYPQGPYHQPPGPYFPPNQIRPMRFEHQSNYQGPPRHHHGPGPAPMMRPSMHDNYGMRHQRPPMNHLANAVTQNIQQRYGTGFIDDPLEIFNRIMREKEMRKERYRRSPAHNERRSRSFERKRSPARPYSPENRRQKNYPKPRKRSRSFKSNSSKSYSRSRSRSRNRSTRGRSKSRSFSPRYRRKENVQSNKDRRDDRHRSPIRRGNHQSSKSSRSNYKGDSSSKQTLRDTQENMQQYHENIGNLNDKNDHQSYDYEKEQNAFDQPHSFDEQPPPPGDESELPNMQPVKTTVEDFRDNNDVKNEVSIEMMTEMNGSNNNKVDSEGRKEGEHHHHHHHKKSRAKTNETSSDDKKFRDKKKRKKSREHEKKKSKKDRKDKDKEKDKKSSSKTGSIDKTPETADIAEETDKFEKPEDKSSTHDSGREEIENLYNDERQTSPDFTDELLKKGKEGFDRSDSFLDINPNVDLDILDEFNVPESKWEREDYKSTPLDSTSFEAGSVDEKKNPEEKVTTEILKRAENAIFARAISAIRSSEQNKKVKTVQDYDAAKKESSPISSAVKRSETKVQAFQVTVPTNETGTRSVELKSSSDGSREKSKKSPMRTSIKNRLGVKIVEKKSKSRTPSRSPKRRLQSDCTKVIRSSRDNKPHSGGGTADRSSGRERYPSTENRRNNNKQLSSCIRVTNDSKDMRRGASRSRNNERRRSMTPDTRRGVIKRPRLSRSRSNSRHRRPNQKSNNDKSYAKPKEPTSRTDDKGSKQLDQSQSDNEKSKAKSSQHTEAAAAPVKKRSRDSSSSSTATSSASSSGSQKHSKRHGKHKVKKKSGSASADSNSNSKRKKSKKEKKAKKKKKSRK